MGVMPCSPRARHVVGVAADGEDAAGDLGMHGLHAAVQHFGKAGDLGNILHAYAGLANEARGAAGGDQFRSQSRQTARKIDNSGFIGDTDEDAANFGHLLQAYDSMRRSRGALAAAEFQREGFVVAPILVDFGEHFGGLGKVRGELRGRLPPCGAARIGGNFRRPDDGQ